MVYELLVASVAVVVYTWIGYPLLLCVLRAMFRRPTIGSSPSASPLVSIIIAVHNEQQRMAAKLRNCLEQDYPKDRLEIIVVSDGSTDQTEAIVRGVQCVDPRIRWLESPSRAGKSGVQNLAAGCARGEVLFFTDANTCMAPDVLRTMIGDFADARVGLVTAAVYFGDPANAVAQGQGIYWRYELFLRAAESDLGILATASGQAMAVRRELFRALPPCYGDDCIVPLDVRLRGYRVLQERRAVVYDEMPDSIGGELRARVRMTARNWSGTLARGAILNPLRYPLTAIGLASHKLLRWLTPLFLSGAFLANAVLSLQGRAVVLGWLQAGFYVSAWVGWWLTRTQHRAWVFGYPFSFCLANIGFLLGMVKVVRSQKIVAY